MRGMLTCVGLTGNSAVGWISNLGRRTDLDRHPLKQLRQINPFLQKWSKKLSQEVKVIMDDVQFMEKVKRNRTHKEEQHQERLLRIQKILELEPKVLEQARRIFDGLTFSHSDIK